MRCSDDELQRQGPKILAATAKRRRRQFSSREEARLKYSARPPFDRFASAALQAYLAHGFRDIPGTLCYLLVKALISLRGHILLHCQPARSGSEG